MKIAPLLLLAGCVVVPENGMDATRSRARQLMQAGSLDAAAEQWVQVISGNSDEAPRLEAARGLLRIVEAKLAKPELRGPASEFDYRRFMLEARVELERYVLDRTPRPERDGAALAAALGDLADELNAPAAGVRRAVAAARQARAQDLVFEGGQAKMSPGQFSATRETVRFVESGARQHLEEAGDAAELANLELCGPNLAPLALTAAIEEGLRHWVWVIELAAPGDVRAIEAARFWRRRL